MKNETKQTAVEWLEKEIDKLFILYQKGFMSAGRFIFLQHKLFQQAKEMEKKETISFASWIAKSEWMSIWVEDKWMWECQLENSNTTYKTDKELFEIFFNETYGGNKL